MKIAKSFDEIKPLVKLCKYGHLFEVQEWIAAGKPIILQDKPKGKQRKSLLAYAIDTGFYSLVQVLLEAGTPVIGTPYNALEHAVDKSRLDIVKLLVKHGANINSMFMSIVFLRRDAQIIAYFIDKGADVERGNPLAWVLTNRIKSALSIFKRYKRRIPSFQEQADIALRYHCKEGNLEWVSLLLSAGANPHSHGPSDPYDKNDRINHTAIETAAFYNRLEILKLDQMRVVPSRSKNKRIMELACHYGNINIVKELMNQGVNLIDPKKDTTTIQFLIHQMGTRRSNDHFGIYEKLYSYKYGSRSKLQMIHFLARNGVNWHPKDKYGISQARKSFLRLKADYIVEFIWIMSGYGTCRYEKLVELIDTPAMKTLICDHQKRVDELIENMME